MTEDEIYSGPYISIQKVNKRHSKKCEFCDEKPENLRIMVWSEDIYKHCSVNCYCLDHGINFLRKKIIFLQQTLKEIEKENKIKDTSWNFLDLD